MVLIGISDLSSLKSSFNGSASFEAQAMKLNAMPMLRKMPKIFFIYSPLILLCSALAALFALFPIPELAMALPAAPIALAAIPTTPP